MAIEKIIVYVQGSPVKVIGVPGLPGHGTGPGGGISQAVADGRYVRQTQVDAADGVAGLDSNEQVARAALPDPLVSYDLLIANLLA